ncbi:hypothetical protein KGA66_11580 [Actinocrinis puniceicyclus]|uniref:Uncharacterized protein n=1 Tax=Actinocrinis puniceicyclus TaxID=977794 RepID=A0A8J7WLX6_9ACTN|nr:hypothetical protein [Actinocrinis puniceicyclus]MBS2963693.1 hypothetical protein [Actinocrinis puniceicyclus]
MPVFDTVTGTERQSRSPLNETNETSPYVIVADALRLDEPAALVVLETGFGVLAVTPWATAAELVRDGVGDGAAAVGLAETDGIALRSADALALALALALAATDETECAVAAAPPGPAHALTQQTSTTIAAPATARSGDLFLDKEPSHPINARRATGQHSEVGAAADDPSRPAQSRQPYS